MKTHLRSTIAQAIAQKLRNLADRVERVMTMRVDLIDMEALREAARQSPWIPPEYWWNDVQADIVGFLRGECHETVFRDDFVTVRRIPASQGLATDDLMALCTLRMCSDPWPVSDDAEGMRRVDAYLDSLARRHGYDGWIAAAIEARA